MVVNRHSPPIERPGEEKLLERIAKRYEELEEKLSEIEAKLLEGDDAHAGESADPRKPR